MLVSVCIFPVTGQTLPLVSLGGSSIVFTCVALGLILGISRQVKEQSLDRPRERRCSTERAGGRIFRIRSPAGRRIGDGGEKGA